MEQRKPRSSDEEPAACRFGGFTLDPGRGALLRPDGTEAELRPKTAELLRHLAAKPGRVVSREELLESVWPGVFVGDDSITQCVAEIRRALGDDGARLLRTLPKRGYLLDAPVAREEAPLRATRPPDDAAGAPARGAGGSLDAPPPGAQDRPSLAVLPFANLGGDPEQEYFADGVTEELTTALSRARWFSVVSRGSAFTYKGKAMDARRVGRELGARYLLEGSVRKAAGQVRIACRLAETEGGRQAWAERFQGDLGDIFALQDRVAEAVALAVEPSLERAEIERVRAKPTESLDAYDLYLRALRHFYAVTREGCDAALALLRRAIALDPGFAPAKAFAATCMSRRSVQGWADHPDEREEGARLAREALAADPDNPVALVFVADALGVLARDAAGAHAAAVRALGFHPNSLQVRNMVGWTCLFVGEPEAAAGHFQYALRLGTLDPSAAYPLTGLAMAHLMAGRPKEALVQAEAALRKVPGLAPGHRTAVAALSLLGRREEAAAAVERFRSANPVAAHLSAAQFLRDLYLDREFAETVIRAWRDAGLPE